MSQLLSDSISVVHCKPAADRLQLMDRNESLQENIDERLYHDYRNETTIAYRYEKHR